MITVLFACVHNAGRSQMAAAFFNAFADPARARAISAGTEPGPRVHPVVVQAMREAGQDLSRAVPKKLTPEMAAQAQILVTLGCGEACPVVPGARVIDWPVSDPKDQAIESVREIRADLEKRVRDLVAVEGLGPIGR
jgi:arsenate reductase